VFTGWVGDTATSNPELRLVMHHPFDITAEFVTEMQVSADGATDEILGVPTLTLQEKDYLDALGNKNHGYDVGDYLALLQRSGLAPSPALLDQAARRSPPAKPRSP
jgi:hypothetical protein